ncbi:MAG: InlB B-repeat-containing protein [Ruminococcus sp.]|nr:InlB B-repeat-containing protein [Ruminococcus sp.]
MLKKRIATLAAAAMIAVTAFAGVLPTGLQVDTSITASAASTVKMKVTLDANGGSCSKSKITVTYGKKYGTLPTPTRSGYNFVGWYNSSGSKVTASTVVNKKVNHTLTAKWEEWPTSVTLTFDANGGNITTTSKTYYSGKIIGALPVVRMPGYTFKGWYTKKTGGTRVSYSTVLNVVKDRTFYAHYAVASFATLKYSFENTYEGFGYSRMYRIPYERYSYMFSAQYARFVYDAVGMTAWGGNCYGMSTTSALFNTCKVKVQSFNKKKYFIKGLSLTDESSTYGITVNEFIESMQVAQYAPSLQDAFEEHLEDYSTLVSKVKACHSGTGQPVVMGLIEGNTGHAVLAYRWKKISSTEERIYIYDCNDNSSAKYITLYKSNGSYTGFEYDSYTSFTWYSFSEIYSVWTNRGTTANGTISSLSVSVDNARIYDENGTLCAVISDGEFTSYDDDVYQTISFDVSLTSTLICLPEGDYTVVNTEDEDMSVAMYADGTTCSAQSDADAITLSVDAETVTVYDEDSADYEITLYTSSGDVTVSGSTDSGTYEVSEDKITEITDDESQLSELVG